MHNGFVTIDNEKMSKSLGNFFTLREIFNDHAPDAVRFFLTRTHYRAPLQYSTDALLDATAAYKKLTSIFDIVPAAPIPTHLAPKFDRIRDQFWAALYNDLNTSEAISYLFELHGLIHEHQCGTTLLHELGSAIGLFYNDNTGVPQHIEGLAKARWKAKKEKNFQTADDLRSQIETAGFVVEDTPDGYRVRAN